VLPRLGGSDQLGPFHIGDRLDRGEVRVHQSRAFSSGDTSLVVPSSTDSVLGGGQAPKTGWGGSVWGQTWSNTSPPSGVSRSGRSHIFLLLRGLTSTVGEGRDVI